MRTLDARKRKLLRDADRRLRAARDAGPDERARRGAAAAAYVRESLSVEAMRAGYEAVYRELDEGAA